MVAPPPRYCRSACPGSVECCHTPTPLPVTDDLISVDEVFKRYEKIHGIYSCVKKKDYDPLWMKFLNGTKNIHGIYKDEIMQLC